MLKENWAVRQWITLLVLRGCVLPLIETGTMTSLVKFIKMAPIGKYGFLFSKCWSEVLYFCLFVYKYTK